MAKIMQDYVHLPSAKRLEMVRNQGVLETIAGWTLVLVGVSTESSILAVIATCVVGLVIAVRGICRGGLDQ